MAVNNSVNLNGTGILTSNGSSTFTYSTANQGSVLLGGASNAVGSTGVLAKGSIIVGDGTTDPTVLSVGTDTHALTADSAQGSGVKWAAVSGAAVWTFVSSSTASASASIAFTGLTDATADYVVIFSNIVPATDGADFRVRTSADGSSYASGASDYFENFFVGDGSSILLADNAGNAAGESISGMITFLHPYVATFSWAHYMLGYRGTDGSSQGVLSMGCRKSSAVVQAIQFSFSTGNITSGTFRLYKIAGT